MKNIDKQQMLILIAGAGLLIAFGVFRYVPIVRQKLMLKDQMTRQSLTMEQIQEYSRRLPELKQQQRRLTEQLQDNAGKIPEGKQFARLWQQIAEVMNTCNLRDQLVQPGNEKTSDELGCVPLTIQCTGSAEQMFQFFRMLEDFERLVCFDQVQLENDSEFSGNLKLNAKAKVYYRPENANNNS